MTSAQVVETSVTKDLLRTTLTRTITPYEILILLGSNHLLNNNGNLHWPFHIVAFHRLFPDRIGIKKLLVFKLFSLRLVRAKKVEKAKRKTQHLIYCIDFKEQLNLCSMINGGVFKLTSSTGYVYFPVIIIFQCTKCSVFIL